MSEYQNFQKTFDALLESLKKDYPSIIFVGAICIVEPVLGASESASKTFASKWTDDVAIHAIALGGLYEHVHDLVHGDIISKDIPLNS